MSDKHTPLEELSLSGLGLLAYLKSQGGKKSMLNLSEKFHDQQASLKEGLDELETLGFIDIQVSLDGWGLEDYER